MFDMFDPLTNSVSNENIHVAGKAIPSLIVHLGGTLVNTAPESTAHPPCLIIRLNGVIHSLVLIPERSDDNNSEDNKMNNDGPDSNEDRDEDGDEGEDEDNLLNEVDRY